MDRNIDMRYMQDGRNPYGSEGGYVVSSRGRGRGRGRGRRGDRGMDYAYDMDMARGGQGGRGRGDRGDYADYDMARGDSRGDMRGGRDGHHYPQGQGSTYYPIQAMGTFEGYYGMPEQDYGRGRDYGYPDMRGRRDYGYDYGYGDYGDYGETLSTEELQKWERKLMEQLDEREKQMFKKEVIIPKFKQMGIEMKDFNEEELYTLAIAKYLDHKQSIGQNPDLAIKLAKDALCDQDAKYKGSEWLAIYFDEFVDD